jgi:hypothetical protein
MVLFFAFPHSTHPHGLNVHEFDVYVNQLGMAKPAALQSATVNATDKSPLDCVRVL